MLKSLLWRAAAAGSLAAGWGLTPANPLLPLDGSWTLRALALTDSHTLERLWSVRALALADSLWGGLAPPDLAPITDGETSGAAGGFLGAPLSGAGANSSGRASGSRGLRPCSTSPRRPLLGTLGNCPLE